MPVTQLPTNQFRQSVPASRSNLRPAAVSPTSRPGGQVTPQGDRFAASESKPDFMQLGRNRSSLISTPTTKVQRAVNDPKIKATLAGFTPTLQQQISGLSDAQVRVLKGGISGTSEVGPLTIDNRKAFIKGNVMMKSIWGNVHQSISDARGKYSMINGPEENGLHKLINTVSELKPEQRKQLAEMMDAVR